MLELVAVVTMVGLVAVVTMFRLHSVSDADARAEFAAHHTKLIQEAVDRYRFDHGIFPANIPALVSDKYLPSFPKAPDAAGTFSIDATTGVVRYESGLK